MFSVLITILFLILKILIIVVPLLISVAYFTLAERKILGAIQRRRGPNVIGAFGLLHRHRVFPGRHFVRGPDHGGG